MKHKNVIVTNFKCCNIFYGRTCKEHFLITLLDLNSFEKVLQVIPNIPFSFFPKLKLFCGALENSFLLCCSN
jgi:hypothetical protein